MRRLIWGFPDCWKSHVTAQLYSFEASDAKSDINSCSDPVCLLGPRFLPLLWFGKTSEIFWIQTIFKLWKQVVERERERLALAYESLVISKNIMYGCWKNSRAHRLLHDKVGYSTVLMLCMLSIAFPNVLIDETFFLEFHSDLIWIRTLTTFFFSFFRERGSKYH